MRYASRLTTGLLMLALLLLAWGCNGCATVQPVPSGDEAQKTRALAVRVADATTAGLAIVKEVGTLVGALPIPTATKDAIDCSVVKVTGTTAPPSQTVKDVCQPIVGTLPNGPGPLHLALGKLGSITAEPALKNTAGEIITAVDPLINRLETSGNASLKALAAALRASFALVRGLL